MRALKFLLIAFVALPVFTTGCYTTESGKTKATFIPWRNDKVQRRYDRPLVKVQTAVRDAINTHGTLTSEEATTNVLTGQINTRHIWVKLTPDPQSPENITAVTFQARTKYGNPDIPLASQLAESTLAAIIRVENAQPPQPQP